MPSLRLLSSDNELKIMNRQQSRADEIMQVIYILIRTWSPFDEMKHSLDELIGTGVAGDDMIQDISVRMRNIGDILVAYYDVKAMSVLDIYDEDGTGQAYSIDIFLEYTDGTFEQNTVKVEAA